MKLKLLFFIFLSSLTLQAENFHSQLIIPSIDINNPFWEFAHHPIKQKEENLFAELVDKWNLILDTLWTKLDNKIKEEIDASTDHIDYYLDDQRFVDSYLNMYQKAYPGLIYNEQDQDIDDIVLNFIHTKLYYLKLAKPVQFYMKDNISLLTTSFGTDKTGHNLIFNKKIYTPEQILSVYNSEIDKTTKYHIEPHTNLHKSRMIEFSNLLHLGLTQAISSVIHQSDFFAKILTAFNYNKKNLSKETQSYGADYVFFQSYLEACLQSKNPLEAALFIEPNVSDFNQNLVLLWREFIEDIKNCYEEDDLEAYESLSLHQRRSILYTHQDEN